MIVWFTYIFVVLTSLYVFTIAMFIVLWIAMPFYKRKEFHPPKTLVSVVIVARNEAKNIERCLHDIINQTFDKSLLEVVVVDDYSTDSTAQLVINLSNANPYIKLIKNNVPPGPRAFKKKAIEQAVAVSKGELIITTDADCSMNPYWLSELVNFYETEKPAMIVGPVYIQPRNNIFEKFQTVEFAGLMLATAATIFIKKPIMCNGANLAYKRAAFEKVNGFEGVDVLASGDDVMLMNKINRCFPGEIKFIKSRRAIVYTNAVPAFKEFLNQRLRWSSKTKIKGNTLNYFIAAVVYIFNLFAIVSIIVLLVNIHLFPVLGPMLFSAFIINFLLLFLGLSFYGVKKYCWIIIPEQLIYLLYVVLIGGISMIKKEYSWKDRKVI